MGVPLEIDATVVPSRHAVQVTALAAVQKLEGKGNIMGISMGSSEGAGYANAEGLSLRVAYEIYEIRKVQGAAAGCVALCRLNVEICFHEEAIGMAGTGS